MAVNIKKGEVKEYPRIKHGKETVWWEYWGKRSSFSEPVLKKERVRVTMTTGEVFVGTICGISSQGYISVVTAAHKIWNNIDCTVNKVEVLGIVEVDPSSVKINSGRW